MPDTIDLNADLGEGSPHEEEVLQQVSSANIACGGHAGDHETMLASLRLCVRYGVAAGAHPSFPDRANFGRRVLDLSPQQVAVAVREQLEGLKAAAQEVGTVLRHVKPHGALYNLAARDPALARAVLQAAADCGLRVCYGLAGPDSALLREARALGLRAIPEGFADRGYAADGTLWPREQTGALHGVAQAVTQGVDIATGQPIRAVSGEPLTVQARSLCMHGDGAQAAEVARRLALALRQAGVRIAAPDA